MKTLIALLIIPMLAFAGCVTTQKACCPSEDVVFFIYTPIGPIPVGIEKNFFNKDTEGEDWISTKEYDKLMNKEEPEQDNDIEVKETELRLELIKQSEEAARVVDEILKF